ncbi:MAG: hypothetical protein ABR598_00865 [Candidatus Dormibacteria bacterium]
MIFGLALGAAAQPAGHVRPLEWLLLVIPMALVFGTITYIYATGDSGQGSPLLLPARRLVSGVERMTKLPAWAAAPIMFGEWSLLLAALGFYWDVAWHIDFGRDKALFTPPHLMILLGLMGIAGAAVLGIAIASWQRAEVGLRFGRVRIPYGALPLAGLGFFAVIGFPLDDLWHRTYGIDVTMWSPTHLMMIGGAVFSPLGLRLLLAEAGPDALKTTTGKVMRRGMTAAFLIALSAFQLEYDLGVPQWQALYQPVLITATAAIAFVVARVSMGRGGAVLMWVQYLGLRLFWYVLVGPVLGHPSPHFPIYLGIALLVEGVWMFGGRLHPLARALAAGVLTGTVGLASEWAWSEVWARHPWQTSLLPGIWVAVAIPVATAVLGLGIGYVLSFRRPPMSGAILVLAAAATVGLMVVPFPRHASDVSATVTTSPANEPRQAIDRDGLPTVVREYNVSLTLQPADAAANSDWFEVMSWQGGKARNIRFVPDGAGRYHAAAPVPTGGTWKSAIFLTKQDVLDALPISMPADSEYNLPAVKVEPVRTAAFVPAEKVLMAENHAGSSVPRLMATTAFFAELGVTALFFVIGLVGLARKFGESDPPQSGRAVRTPGWRAARAS